MIRSIRRNSAPEKPRFQAKRTGESQNFASAVIPLDVSMRRFVPVASIEKEPIRSYSKACRHASESVTPTARRKAFPKDADEPRGGARQRRPCPDQPGRAPRHWLNPRSPFRRPEGAGRYWPGQGCGGHRPGLATHKNRVTLSRLGCYAGIRQLLPGSQLHRCHETHRRGQPLQSEALNAKNAPESTICGILPSRSTTTGSVAWLVPISFPRSAPRRGGRTNLRPNALRLSRSPQPCGWPPPHSSSDDWSCASGRAAIVARPFISER